MNSIKLSLFMFILLNCIPFVYMFYIGFSAVDMYKLLVYTSNTFLLALFSVLLSFVFAIPSAYIFTSKKYKFKYLVSILLLLISILPPFLLSIVFTNFFFFFNIPNGFLTLSFAHMIMIFPYTLIFMIVGFNFVPKSAKYSAKLYTESSLKGFIMFYVPFMKSTFLVAVILGITISMSQYIITLMLSDPSFSTLMLQIIPYLKSADLKSASTYGIVFIFNSIFAIFFIYRFKNVISKN